MVKFVRAKMNQITNKALAELFADTKDEAEAIIKGDTSKIYGWPMKYSIEEGSTVKIPSGSVGIFDSNGNVAGWTAGGGGGGTPESPVQYIDLDQDGEADTTASKDEVDGYIEDLWNDPAPDDDSDDSGD